MNIGRNIKKRRLELSLTLEDVAKRIGTSKQTIQRYEQGIISNIPHDKIEALANVLITSPSRLMGWVESDKEAFNISIGERIKARREELHFTQRELAKLMGYSNHSTIARIESGLVDIPYSCIEQFAKVLGVSVSYILETENEKKPEVSVADDNFVNEQSGLNRIQQKIKLQRKKNGYSYSQLSALTGIPKASLHRYETGTTTKIPIDVISKLEKAFALQPGALTEIYHLENSAFNTSCSTCVFLSEHEANVIAAYRDNKEMQKAIDVLLGVNTSEGGK